MQFTLFYLFLRKPEHIFNHRIVDSYFSLRMLSDFRSKRYIFLNMKTCLAKVQKVDVKPGYIHTKKENSFVRFLKRNI